MTALTVVLRMFTKRAAAILLVAIALLACEPAQYREPPSILPEATATWTRAASVTPTAHEREPVAALTATPSPLPPLAEPQLPNQIHDVAFVDEQHGWMIGAYQDWHTVASRMPSS